MRTDANFHLIRRHHQSNALHDGKNSKTPRINTKIILANQRQRKGAFITKQKFKKNLHEKYPVFSTPTPAQKKFCCPQANAKF